MGLRVWHAGQPQRLLTNSLLQAQKRLVCGGGRGLLDPLCASFLSCSQIHGGQQGSKNVKGLVAGLGSVCSDSKGSLCVASCGQNRSTLCGAACRVSRRRVGCLPQAALHSSRTQCVE